jgi:hypothetical protein
VGTNVGRGVNVGVKLMIGMCDGGMEGVPVGAILGKTVGV